MNLTKNECVFSVTSDDKMDSFRPSKFCSDLAFWKEKCFSRWNDSKYVESTRCKTYEYQFSSDNQCQINEIYCPNKDKCFSDVKKCEAHFYFGNKTQCRNQNMYHCPASNQCIWQDWVCDGFVQCLKGDDEDFDLCYNRGSFAEGATFKCNETQRFGYNVTILATKCNKIEECRDGNDEKNSNCQSDDSKGLRAILVVFAMIFLSWIVIHFVYEYDGGEEKSIPKADQEYAQNAKGDSLAILKVSEQFFLQLLRYLNKHDSFFNIEQSRSQPPETAF